MITKYEKLKTFGLIIIGSILCANHKIEATDLVEGITQKQFNIVTVTRQKIVQYDEPLLLNEIFVLFKNIDNILGGGCFTFEYINYAFSWISNFYCNELTDRAIDKISNQHITQYHSSLYSKLIPKKEERQQIQQLLTTLPEGPSEQQFKSQIRSIFSHMNKKIGEKLNQTTSFDRSMLDLKKPTLLVFQESIFSQRYLLNDEYINFIIELCKKLTLFYNISVHVNLLHQFDSNSCPSWIKKAQKVEEIEINSKKEDTGTTVANYSLIISGGEVTYVYIKTEQDGTLKEDGADLFIEKKFKLKSGKLKWQDLDSNLNFCKKIATRICADMNLLVDKNCKYTVALEDLDTDGILIIQSNTFDLFNIKDAIIRRKKDNDESYLNRFIIHCDPVNGASVFKITEEEKIMACPPINSEKWPQYSQEYKNVNIRIPSGIEIDVNNEDCTKKSKNGKLFYMNVWSFNGDPDNLQELKDECRKQ